MSQKTVLVADDDSAIRTVLTQALIEGGLILSGQRPLQPGSGDGSQMGWVTVVVTDGGTAGRKRVRCPASRIKKLRPTLPVIVMSAKNTIMTAITAADRGAYDYLPKPFDLNTLVSLVGRAAENSVRPEAAPQPANENLPIIGDHQPCRRSTGSLRGFTQDRPDSLSRRRIWHWEEWSPAPCMDYGKRRPLRPLSR